MPTLVNGTTNTMECDSQCEKQQLAGKSRVTGEPTDHVSHIARENREVRLSQFVLELYALVVFLAQMCEHRVADPA